MKLACDLVPALLFAIAIFQLAKPTYSTHKTHPDVGNHKNHHQNHRFGGIKHCDHIVDLCEERVFTVGAELGVQIGIFAEKNLKRWSTCQTYYLIDLWKHQENYTDFANAEDSVQLANMNQTSARLKPFGSKPGGRV